MPCHGIRMYPYLLPSAYWDRLLAPHCPLQEKLVWKVDGCRLFGPTLNNQLTSLTEVIWHIPMVTIGVKPAGIINYSPFSAVHVRKGKKNVGLSDCRICEQQPGRMIPFHWRGPAREAGPRVFCASDKGDWSSSSIFVGLKQWQTVVDGVRGRLV